MNLAVLYLLANIGFLYIARDSFTKVLAGFFGLMASGLFLMFAPTDYLWLIGSYALINLVGMFVALWRE